MPAGLPANGFCLLQARAILMRSSGGSQDAIDRLFAGQHTWAGQRMYTLCVDLRGFYLKVGMDFVSLLSSCTRRADIHALYGRYLAVVQ